MRRVAGLIACSIVLSGTVGVRESFAQQVATAIGRYVPLQTMRAGHVKMPPALARRVTVRAQRVLLQNVLLNIANQAGLGLSYSDEVARSLTHVSVDLTQVRAADALAQAVEGTPWSVLVTPEGQVTVVPGAQRKTGAIVGRVTDPATGHGLPGADVFLEKTPWRTTTDSNGAYRLEVESGRYTLTVRRLGYGKQSLAVTIRDGQTDTVDVTLKPVATRLNEIVSTATGPRRRIDIANDVTTINADSVMQTAPIRSVTDLLETRVPGLTVQHTSGAPGDPARLRLRGVSSVLASNDPIIIVDGIRVYSDQSANRSANLARRPNSSSFSGAGSYNPASDTSAGQGYTSAAPSPLDYIDPNTIDKIEVVKGPSAAALYGPDAANGVIVITTKKGKAGPTRWTGSLDYAPTTPPRGQYPELVMRWGHDILFDRLVNCPASNMVSVGAVGSAAGIRCVGDSITTFQILNDPALTVLADGHRTGGSLAAGGGTQSLTYSFTGSYADEVGTIKLPAYEVDRYRSMFSIAPPDWMQRPQQFTQWGVTSALQARLGSKADVSLSSSLSRTEQRKSQLQDQLHTLMTTYFDKASGRYYLDPDQVVSDPVTESPLGYYYERATASATEFRNDAQLQYRPWSAVTLNAIAGLQVVQRVDQVFSPRGAPGDSPADTAGRVIDGQGRSVMSTVTLRGNAFRPLGRGFQFNFALGIDYTGRSTSDVAGGTSNLAPGSSLQGSVTDFVRRGAESDATFGWYAEPSIGNRKLNFSSGLRLASGTSFGASVGGFSLPTFPKLGFSYLISDEPWFPFKNLVQSLRLRIAYGRASRHPDVTSKLRLYGTPVQLQSDDQLHTSILLTSLGNTEVRPERTAELEGGFDIDLLDSRLTLGMTGYRKTTNDALMNVPVAPEIYGDGLSITKNIGVTRNTGLELTAGAQVVRSKLITWSTQLSFHQTRNILVELGQGVTPFYTEANGGSIANANGGLRVAPGYPINARWSLPITGYADANGDGALEVNEVQLGDTAVYLGPTMPDYTATLASTVSLWHAVTINANFSRESGTAQRNEVAFALARFSAGQEVPGTPVDQQLRSIDLTSGGGVPATDYNWIQTVTSTRFASFSVGYRVPAVVARRLGAQSLDVMLQASNLKLWTNYGSADPNVNAFGVGNNVSDTGVLPTPRTWQLRFHAAF